jgi:hypothetical protein
MTYGIGRAVFSGAGRLRSGACCLAVLALAGCAGTSVETAPVEYGPGVVGPKDTGTYPNLNIPPQQAAPQFTEADKNAALSALAADRAAAAKAGGAKPAATDAAQFDKLAKTEARETLKAIGSPCDPALDPACK